MLPPLSRMSLSDIVICESYFKLQMYNGLIISVIMMITNWYILSEGNDCFR